MEWMLSELQVLHRLPGRLRLRLEKLRGNDALASVVSSRLAVVPGIRSVEVNPLTGSVLLQYDKRVEVVVDSLMGDGLDGAATRLANWMRASGLEGIIG